MMPSGATPERTSPCQLHCWAQASVIWIEAMAACGGTRSHVMTMQNSEAEMATEFTTLPLVT